MALDNIFTEMDEFKLMVLPSIRTTYSEQVNFYSPQMCIYNLMFILYDKSEVMFDISMLIKRYYEEGKLLPHQAVTLYKTTFAFLGFEFNIKDFVELNTDEARESFAGLSKDRVGILLKYFSEKELISGLDYKPEIVDEFALPF